MTSSSKSWVVLETFMMPFNYLSTDLAATFIYCSHLLAKHLKDYFLHLVSTIILHKGSHLAMLQLVPFSHTCCLRQKHLDKSGFVKELFTQLKTSGLNYKF